MKRRTFDRIVSFVGLGLSVFLFVAAALLNWGASFADEIKVVLDLKHFLKRHKQLLRHFQISH